MIVLAAMVRPMLKAGDTIPWVWLSMAIMAASIAADSLQECLRVYMRQRELTRNCVGFETLKAGHLMTHLLQ